ncbi:unnamed protein product, partial [Owenia fusiformis]
VGCSGTVAAFIAAVYLNYPAPELSPSLARWKQNGNYFDYKEIKIFYREETSPVTKNLSPLVCLHGFPTSGYDWHKMFPELTEKFGRVIAMDFIGYGFSDKPVDHDYSIMEQADIIEALLNKLGVTKVHVLAHDYGDTVAQELLARFEDRKASGSSQGLHIETVCLLNGGIFPETNFPRIGQKALLIPGVGAVLGRLMFYRAFKRSFGEVLGKNSQTTEEEFQDFWAAIRYNNGNAINHKLLQYIPERRQNRGRWVGVLQTTSVPVHVIYGPDDPVNPQEFVEYYNVAIPNPSIIILGGGIGHYPQTEAPRDVTFFYFNFIDEQIQVKPS